MELREEGWSENLKRVKPKIKRIFYEGNLELLDERYKRLAVVGTRKMTEYGARVIEEWMREFVGNELVIVSGLMYGVDQKAHWECLSHGGKTIAVLGMGFDRVAAAERLLMNKIVQKGGLVLSEYEDDFEATRWSFPQRNRVVVGVSDGVLVVEAAEKSGSLITALVASKVGLPLMAVPGEVFSPVASGVNELIRGGKAKMVTSAGEVIERMGEGQVQVPLGLGLG